MELILALIFMVGVVLFFSRLGSKKRMIHKKILADISYLEEHGGGAMTLTSEDSYYDKYYRMWDRMVVREHIVKENEIIFLNNTPTGLELCLKKV